MRPNCDHKIIDPTAFFELLFDTRNQIMSLIDINHFVNISVNPDGGD